MMEVVNELFKDSGIRRLVVKRVFDAPLEQVFEAWVNPDIVAEWWGPKGFTSPICFWNPKPNGHIYIEMAYVDGNTYPIGGMFHEVEPLNRLLFTSTAFENDPHHPYLKVLNAVKFTTMGNRTEVWLNASIQLATGQATGALKGMEEGWTQSMDKLDALLVVR